MGRYRGVILDVDGTLVDSDDAHACAWVEALREHGYATTFEQARRLIGMGSDKLLSELAGLSKDGPKGKQVAERRKQLFKERFLPGLKPLPGSRELLVHMRHAGLKLVVASSAEGDELQALLAVAGAEDLVAHSTSSSDAARSKPDPDIVEAAVASTGYEPEQLVMLGDTPYDVEAAARAGVATIAVRSGGWDDAALSGAIAVYDDPADLLLHYGNSPLG